MKKEFKKIIDFINFSLKVDANSTSTASAFQPKAPAKLDKLKKSR